MEVIPVINCHVGDLDCVKSREKKTQSISKWVHLDVADGKFTFNKSWAEPEVWKTLQSPLNLEVHLMCEEPEKAAKDWVAAGAKRLIVHAEALTEDSAREVVRLAREVSAGVMLALNPETSVKELPPYFRNFAEYEILAVHPGLPGQKLLPLTLQKVGDLRREVRSARIQVDGGINPDTIKKIKEAGADSVVSGSFIFGSGEPEKAYRELLTA